MTIKLVVGECTLNVVSAYAPQVGCEEEIKRRFWEGLDDIVRSIPPSERLFIGGDFNGHIGSSAGAYTEVHGGFGFGNGMEGASHCWILPRRGDRRLCEDCKVIPGDTLATQHRLLVMDVSIRIRRKQRSVRGRPRIRWDALTKVKAQELEG
uniref:Craniofacial development protein 2-like n=1 Tax=Nicotiana tabacum TaxID=4097 RepID=A0A1S3XSR4_TOBAC